MACSKAGLTLVALALVAAFCLAGSGPAQAAFPGSNGQIAFSSDRTGSSDIYVTDAQGATQTDLTNSAAFDCCAAWSPDGTQIAFASDRDQNGNVDIYVMQGDGTGVTRLTTDPGSDADPTWSPDGSRIAFASNRDGNSEIYSMDSNGSNQTDLTNNSGSDFAPAWSPDGTKIAFTREGDGVGDAEIFVMNADGTGQTNLTNNTLVVDLVPSWSPNGAEIAFATNRDGNFEIYSMDANGANPTNLTNDPAADGPETAWSPDGTKIAFQSYRNGNYDVYTMDANGANQTDVTNNAAVFDVAPDWQRQPGSVSQSLTGPGTVTTDVTNSGATSSSPLQTSVTTTTSGDVSIETAPASAPPSGYAVLGRQVSVSAPAATSASPLILTFRIDVSLLGGITADTIQLFKDGSQVPDCTNPTSGAAAPDPCISARVALGDGDIALTVLTSSASNWQLATHLPYNFSGFLAPVDNPATVNAASAGSAIPVRFGLGGPQGLNIFAFGFPKSAKVDCNSGALEDAIEQTVTAGSSTLSYDAGLNRYVYVWKTDKSWSGKTSGPCRRLTVKLNDGSSHVADFHFR